MGCGASTNHVKPIEEPRSLERVESYFDVDSAATMKKKQEEEERKEQATKDESKLQSIMQAIAVKLQLPDAMINKCIQSLHDNGIYIVDPLLNATSDEWTALNLPLAVLRELRSQISQMKQNNSTNETKRIAEQQHSSAFDSKSSYGNSGIAENSHNSNALQSIDSKKDYSAFVKPDKPPMVNCECGRSVPKDLMDAHLQTCPSRVPKTTLEAKKGPTEAVQLAASSSRNRRMNSSRSIQRKGSQAIDERSDDDTPTPFDSDAKRNTINEKYTKKAFQDMPSQSGSLSRDRGKDIVASLIARQGPPTSNDREVQSSSSQPNVHRNNRYGNSNGAFGFSSEKPVFFLEDEIITATGHDSGNTKGQKAKKSSDLESGEKDELYVMAKTFKNGDKYAGQFNAANKQHGKGKYTFVNGDVYEGDFKSGFFEGIGTFRRANGDYYTGQFKQDLFEGKGTYIYRDGEKYIGDYVQGERQGHGIYHYKNGNTFEGEFRRGDIFGEGLYTFANNDKYEGVIQNGTFAGGKYTFQNGDSYQGHYKGSIPHGLGIMQYANKDTYEGYFHESKRHGRGKYTSSNGKVHEGNYIMGKREGLGKYMDDEGVYEGEFRDGKMSGKGAFTFHNGDWYEGDFENNVFEGQGIMVERNSKYEGNWLAGLRHGYGKWVTEQGEVYEGEFRSGTMDGQGSYTWSNGNNYRGQFKFGKPHGRGVFTFADTGETIQGEFIDGRPSNPTHRIRHVDTPNQSLGNGKEKPRNVTATQINVSSNKGNSGKVHTPFLGQYSDSLF